jgi:flagellar hook-associated protein 1 FlgK
MLTSALYSSFAGIRNTESKISVTADNVANADKPGYTRKEYETSYAATVGRTLPSSGTIATVDYNPFLLEAMIEDISIASKNSLLSDYRTAYANELGFTDGDNSASAYLNDIITGLDRLALTPEDDSLKSQVVFASQRLANELNRISVSIQDSRLQADEEIEALVVEINNRLERIDDLNQNITFARTTGVTTANLEDDRRVELEALSELIDINYFTNQDGEIKIDTQGRPLLDSRAHTITYTANTALDKNTLYPAGFNAIDLDGFDLTPVVSSGKLGALIEVRDDFMVEEQAKLDEFANVLIREMNEVLNEGASIPPRQTMIGSLNGLNVGTPLGATGSVRIATVDANGIVQNFTDINLAPLLDVGDLIAAINGALGPDVTAGISPDNEFQIVANNAGEGLAINELTSSLLPDGENFSDYFGLNNLFDGDGADNITVSEYLTSDTAALATSRLTGGVLAIGDTGLFVGDSSLTQDMNNAFGSTYSFNAAGNFAGQTELIDNYIDKIIADAAFRANDAATDAEIGQALVNQTRTTLTNLSGVNIDEEMTTLIDLEARYEASATLLATIQDMFDTLISAVR